MPKSPSGPQRPILDEWFWNGESLSDHNPLMAGWAVNHKRTSTETRVLHQAALITERKCHIAWLFESSKIMLQSRIEAILRYMHSMTLLEDEVWFCHVSERLGLDLILEPAILTCKELGVVPKIGYLSSRRKATGIFSDFWIPGDKLYLAKYLLGDMAYAPRAHFYHVSDVSLYRHFDQWYSTKDVFMKGAILQRGYFRAPSKDAPDLEARLI